MASETRRLKIINNAFENISDNILDNAMGNINNIMINTQCSGHIHTPTVRNTKNLQLEGNENIHSYFDGTEIINSN